ncbi:MAG: cyclopropane-fatty-acyl-phospholipid synthase family protein [Candidatus Competibacteraceae bacterium]
MSESILSDTLVAPAFIFPRRAGERLWRQLARRRLQALRRGRIILIDAEGSRSFGQTSSEAPLQATVYIYDPKVYTRLALRGHIGAGEGYMAGEWSCEDLTALIRIMLLNRDVMNGLERGPARLAMPLFRLGRALRRNTRRGSRANIAAHYDLGNDFYRLFLDETLMYSCAVFPTAGSSLEEASFAKLERICHKLQLGPQDHLLEIGTGWGGFALHAAARYGCRVTTTTISRRQYELARERVRQAGLEERVTVLLQDYRELEGRYDKLVSIEMIEAVGHNYLPTYLRQCSRLLKPDGMLLLQAITIADQECERARRTVDFIQHYIFPGGCLPSTTAIIGTVSRVTDLRLFHFEDIGAHYALTLQHWRQRFLNRLEQVKALGFSDSFIRMWEFYLCYCEGGFRERSISAVQMLFTQPLCRRDPLPLGLESCH